MTVQVLSAAVAMGQLDAFGALIDVRSPSEFAEDHLPGAVNWPVLDDEERKLVGTEYAQVSSFEAKKRGAALVAKNIATHIEREVMDKPKAWQPLVYCWRGGQRSGAMAWFLDQMGFRTHVVEGGYKAFRAAVRETLDVLPQRFRYRVICGKTGSGKTRLLGALRDADHADGRERPDPRAREAVPVVDGDLVGVVERALQRDEGLHPAPHGEQQADEQRDDAALERLGTLGELGADQRPDQPPPG